MRRDVNERIDVLVRRGCAFVVDRAFVLGVAAVLGLAARALLPVLTDPAASTVRWSTQFEIANANGLPWPVVALALVLCGFPHLIAMIMIPVYLAITVVASGATPGQRCCGLNLCSRGGGIPSVARLLLWYVASVISGMLCGIGYLWALVDREGRTMHDIVAGVSVTQCHVGVPQEC